MQDDFCRIYGLPPSYIRDVLRSNESVILVHRKPNKLLSPEQIDDTLVDISNNTLDLTGNPLFVDLKGDVNLSVVLSHSNNWTDAESKHHPMSLKEGRKFINNFNKSKSKNEGISSSSVYCVCDGSDGNRTVVLGCCVSDSNFRRTQIFTKGCFARTDPVMNVESMQQEHSSCVRQTNSRVDTTVTGTYVIYGCDLKNCNISNCVEYNGSILLEVLWNSCQYSVPDYVKSMELTLQVITGHRDSEINTFWEQLFILNNYISILLANLSNLEQIPITNDPKDYMEICSEIDSTLNINVVRRLVVKNSRETVKLNMQDLREETLTDKLWSILIHCSNIGDLKICLQILFEGLAENKSLKIPECDASATAMMMSRILAGKIAVPNLTSMQALQFLIELGIEKLKRDYYHILNHFGCLDSEKLLNYWSTITSQTKPEIRSSTLPARIPRLTILPTTSIVNTSELVVKFSFLTQMHTTAEFLLLAKRFTVASGETAACIVQQICSELLSLDDPLKLSPNLPPHKLHELKLDLKSTSGKFLQGKYPFTWNLKLTTTNSRSTITTVFHHSTKPVFPPSIYDDYGVGAYSSLAVPVGDSDRTYYVTKAVTYTDDL